MSDRTVVILVLVAVVTIVLAFAVWEFFLKEEAANGIESEYCIDIWMEDKRIGKVCMDEIEELPTVSFEDTLGSGAVDEGPLLKDVILLAVNESLLSNSTNIQIESGLTLEERTLPWGEIANISNSFILDFTNRGTTKFTSPETQKKDRVRDVTDVEIGV